MIKLSITRILLLICIVSGVISLILESIALSHDQMWNSWLEKEIESRNNTAPEKLTSKSRMWVQRAKPPKNMAELIKKLRRDNWLEPVAIALISTIVIEETVVLVLVMLEKITESSRKMALIFCVQIALHIVFGILMVSSVCHYESGYYVLSTAKVEHQGGTYGEYKELLQCTSDATDLEPDPVTGKRPHPVKYACQQDALKLSSAGISVLVTFIYAIGFPVMIFYTKPANRVEPVAPVEIKDSAVEVEPTESPKGTSSNLIITSSEPPGEEEEEKKVETEQEQHDEHQTHVGEENPESKT